MQIVTNQSNLSDIYSSSLKIIIAAQDRNILLDILEIDRLQSQIKVYQFDGKSQKLLPLQQPNIENNITLDFPPSFCLGLIGFSETGINEIKQLSSWWSSQDSSQLPSIIKFDATSEKSVLQAEFWQQMFVLMAQQTQAIAQRIAAQQKQYLGLRTLHEDMQNAFATVEDYLSQAKLPTLQLTFDVQLTDKLVEPTQINNSNSLILKQLLPVSSRGLAVIELHVAKQHSKAVGYLRISLKTCEDTTSIAVWQVPYDHLTEGWLSLDLPSIDLGRKRDVELILKWHTDIGPAPALSLTKLQTINEAKAYNEDTVLEHSLAVRIWQGLPGTRKVTSPYLLLTNQDRETSSLPQLGYLGQGAMAKVLEVTPNLPTDDFEHIQVIDRGAKIMTHPRADGSATIAMLPYCFPANANQLTASIATEHSEAGIIEYAIAIIKPDTDPHTCFNTETALAFSQWIAVEPNTPRKITLDCEVKREQHCHVVIATKLAEGSHSDFAWSHWLNFQTAYQQQSAKLELRSQHAPSIAKETHLQEAKSVNNSPHGRVISDHIDISPTIITKPNLLRDASVESASTFAKVQLIEDGRKIQVHPIYDGDTVAVISNAVKPGVTKVTTTVCTENEAASVIEYAIAMIATDDDTVARAALTSPASNFGFSGWQKVKPSIPFELEISLAAPTTDTYHLVLATRLPANSSQSNAWARWLNIKYLVPSEAAAKVLIEN